MREIYNSRCPAYKSPFGAAAAGDAVSFRIYLPLLQLDSAPVLKIYRMDAHETPYRELALLYTSSDFVGAVYGCVFIPEEAGLFSYCFEVTAGGKKRILKKGAGSAGVWDDGAGLWQLTVYNADMRTPAPLREGVIYQIFPDRFYASGTPKAGIPSDRTLRFDDWGNIPHWRPDGEGAMRNNDFFGGDLQGIIEKLDYLEALGVTVIYLNPIFEAHSNHRYDTADYMRVDPVLGANEDFAWLCASAKARGISIIIDGVFNHTGADSIYFNKTGRYGSGGAYNDPESPYFPWYSFTGYPDEYESWWGFNTLPSINETEPSYMEFICGESGVIRHWLKLGASGFRLDVADELPDKFIDAINHCIKSYDPDCVLLGEVWEDASNKISYGVRRRYLLGGQFDSIMNYPFMNAILSYVRDGSHNELYETVMQILENYPPPVVRGLMNMLSTHDTPRTLTQLAGKPMIDNDRLWQEANHFLSIEAYERGCKLAVLAAVMQFGLPGIPCVYYGDETGQSGYRDPFNRVCYPWDYRNHELIEKFSRLGRMRGDYPIFGDAAFMPITFTKNVCVFLRDAGSVSFLFAVNRSGERRSIYLPDAFKNIVPYFLSGEYQDGLLGPLSGIVLIAAKEEENQ